MTTLTSLISISSLSLLSIIYSSSDRSKYELIHQRKVFEESFSSIDSSSWKGVFSSSNFSRRISFATARAWYAIGCGARVEPYARSRIAITTHAEDGMVVDITDDSIPHSHAIIIDRTELNQQQFTQIRNTAIEREAKHDQEKGIVNTD
jgi:hypothetical protein